MKKYYAILFTALIFLPVSMSLTAQTSESSLRSSVNIEMKIAKNLKFEITPEYRFSPAYNTSFLLVQAGLNYRVATWLTVGGLYRLKSEKLQDTEGFDGSSYDLSNRFALDVSSKFNLSRFTPKFRVRFCNFSDFDGDTEDKSNYMRYRIGLDYNIRGIKLTPFASVEFYQKLSSGLFSKSRYSIGAEYEFNKKNAISLGYSLDDKYKSVTRYHIFELTYKLKF